MDATQESSGQQKTSSTGENVFGQRFARHRGAARRMARVAEILRENEDLDQVIRENDVAESDVLGECATDVEAFVDELQRPYNVMIAGVQNAGKSTLLNVLLGRELMPVGRRTVDGVLSMIEYGDTEEAEIVYRDGSTEKVGTERVFSVIDQREKHLKDERKDISYCVIRLPDENLKTFRFVNTPGLDDRPEIVERTENFFKRADSVLWVFDSTRIEQVNIVGEVLDLARRYRQRIIAVLNKWDRVERSGSENEKQVLHRFEELFEGCYEHRFQFTARDAATAFGMGKIPTPESEDERIKLLENSRYELLMRHFEEHFFGADKEQEKVEKSERKFEAQLGETLHTLDTLADKLDSAASASNEDKGELNQALNEARFRHAKVQRELRGIAEKHAGNYMNAYVTAAERAGKAILNWKTPFRGQDALAEAFEEKLEEEVERLYPRERLVRALERDSAAVVEEQWREFQDWIDEKLPVEVSLEGVDVDIGDIDMNVPLDKVVANAIKVAVGYVVRVAGKEAATNAIEKAIKGAIKKVIVLLSRIISKEILTNLLKQLAKKANPVLAATAVLDVNKFRKEYSEALEAARADVVYELESQRPNIEEQLVESIRQMNDHIRDQIVTVIQANFDEEERKIDELKKLCARTEELHDTLTTFIGKT